MATLIGLANACDDGIGVAPAGIPNLVDTVVVHAVQGTAIALESGYDIALVRIARIDKDDFDFAFNIDNTGEAVILPAGALGLLAQAGIQLSDKSFEDIDEAPFDDYQVSEAVPVSVDDVFVGRSRGFGGNCYYLGALPRYGKFRVLSVDFQARTITLETLVNANCGYRGLEEGFPQR